MPRDLDMDEATSMEEGMCFGVQGHENFAERQAFNSAWQGYGLTMSEVWRPGAASLCTPSSMFASRLASMVSLLKFLPPSPLLAVSWPTATNVFAFT